MPRRQVLLLRAPLRVMALFYVPLVLHRSDGVSGGIAPMATADFTPLAARRLASSMLRAALAGA